MGKIPIIHLYSSTKLQRILSHPWALKKNCFLLGTGTSVPTKSQKIFLIDFSYPSMIEVPSSFVAHKHEIICPKNWHLYSIMCIRVSIQTL